MIGYKGFNKDLTCTMGKGIFQYEVGKWHKEESAKCASTGFHATDNPLDVLAYYNKENDRYFIVKLRGNVDEDGINSRISAPEIMLVKELMKDELYHEGVVWMAEHPKAPWAAVVKRESGEASGSGNVVVRGRKPKARGGIGAKLYIVREDKEGDIVEIGCFEVDGIHILPDRYYNAKGGVVSE